MQEVPVILNEMAYRVSTKPWLIYRSMHCLHILLIAILFPFRGIVSHIGTPLKLLSHTIYSKSFKNKANNRGDKFHLVLHLENWRRKKTVLHYTLINIPR